MADNSIHSEPKTDIGLIALDDGISVRRMVVHAAEPKGTVLLLHGFPETLYAWRGIADALAETYDVHTFDWPGYGLSSRPRSEEFSYAPVSYAEILRQYIAAAGIDRSTLTIYATDISALPVLLLALQEPNIARRIIVGDFAPFDRPDYMNSDLRNLKEKASSSQVLEAWKGFREHLVQGKAFGTGLPADSQFDVPNEFKDDMARGWDHGAITTMEAFYHYYSFFTRDQNDFEQRLETMQAPIAVIWGDLDSYIDKAMGVELAERLGVELDLLSDVGHYPHLQAPDQIVARIRDSFL